MTEATNKRSGCLSAFIIVMIILYALGAVVLFLAGPILNSFMPEYAEAASGNLINGILAVLSIVFLIGVWKYKKWGFYGFVAVAVINIALSIYMGGSLLTSLISGLVFPAILYFLVRPIWNHMQ